ncbi:MAG: hypothetical protein DMF85_03920 [Acidobacteria bacterium]|nr:MAG: hypothetical protein DMF85_03920 [Acidobacteriota bacterium]
MCYHDPRVRILMDYRPALRERTGVGEYVHELASALARRLAPEDSLALFSSSWRDRLAHDAVPGADTIDRRIPVRVLNFAWHRFEWPPIERLAGTVDVAHSIHPLLMPSRAAGQLVTIHDLDFLDHPDRTRGEIRRDYAGLAPSHARRADGVIAVSRFTARQIVDRLEVPSERITVCSPGAPRWTPRTEHRSAGPILFVGTLEARKNVGTLLRAYGRVPPDGGRPAARRPGRISRLHPRRGAARPVRLGVDVRAAVVSRGLRHPRPRGHGRGRSRRRQPARRAAGGRRRRGSAGRSGG